MMMAFDSSRTPPSRLDDESIASVRLALRAYLSDASEASALQTALVAISAEARAKSMMPEQLLVALKEAWNTLPEVRAMTDSAAQVRLLQRIVTMCIKEYYSV